MLGTTGDPGDIAGEARLAERLGFDLAAAGEHVFFHGPVANAFVTLAAAAAVTERIRLLSAVTILPMYPMVMAAKMAATLDLVSHGRFAEYHAAGAGTVIFSAACPPERRPAVTELFAGAVLPRLTRDTGHGVAR